MSRLQRRGYGLCGRFVNELCGRFVARKTLAPTREGSDGVFLVAVAHYPTAIVVAAEPSIAIQHFAEGRPSMCFPFQLEVTIYQPRERTASPAYQHSAELGLSSGRGLLARATQVIEESSSHGGPLGWRVGKHLHRPLLLPLFGKRVPYAPTAMEGAGVRLSTPTS